MKKDRVQTKNKRTDLSRFEIQIFPSSDESEGTLEGRNSVCAKMTIGASYLYTPVTSCVTVFACFKSYKALVTADGRDDREWLTYWVLAALFDLLLVMTNCTLFIIPFYDEAKLGLSVFLVLGGAAKICPVLEPYLKEGEKAGAAIAAKYEPLLQEKLATCKALYEEKTANMSIPGMTKKPEVALEDKKET